MTGTEDEESQLELAKRCATYHVQGIQASEPTIPSGGDEDLSDAMIYAGGFWQDVESQIQSLELSDLIEEP